MVEKKAERDELKKIIDSLNEVNEIDNLAEKRKDDRSNNQIEAEKELREYAHKVATVLGIQGYKGTPETISDEEVREYLKMGQRVSTSRASQIFSEHLNDIILRQTPQKTLEKLAQNGQIVTSAEGGNQEILAKYKGYRDLEEFVGYYQENKKPRNESEAEMVARGLARGVGKAQRKKLEEMGIKDIDLLNIAEGAALASAKAGHIKEEAQPEYVLEGLKEVIKERKKEYEELKERAMDAVRETVIKLGKGKPNEFKFARDILYSTHTGNEDYISRRYRDKAA